MGVARLRFDRRRLAIAAFACASFSGCSNSPTTTAVYAVAKDSSTLSNCQINAKTVLLSTGYGQINSASNAANETALVFGTRDGIVATVICNPRVASTTVVFTGPPGSEMDGALTGFGGAYTAASSGGVLVPATAAPAPTPAAPAP